MRVFQRTPLDLTLISKPQGQVYLVPERCKGCAMCIDFCPEDVLRVSEQRNASGYHIPEVVPGKEADCVHCEFCTMICPEFAIFTRAVEPQVLA
jgi:2-oxoglutarate ferredoxin oxidoreductase subunit delta